MISKTVGLGLCTSSPGYFNYSPEDSLRDLLMVFGPICNGPSIEIHVFFHALKHGRVARNLQGGTGFIPVDRTAAGGEADQIGARGNFSGDGHGIVSGTIHEVEPRSGERLGVFEHRLQACCSALTDCPERLLKDGRESPELVSGCRIVADVPVKSGYIVFPPPDQ